MNHEHERQPDPTHLPAGGDAERAAVPPEPDGEEGGFSAVPEQDPRRGLYLKVESETPPDEIRAALVRASDLFQKHGRPFAAFMRLPDVLATDPNLEKTFLEAYVGEFESWDQIVDQWLVVHGWNTALHDFAAQYGMEEFIAIDRALLRARINEVWDVVPDGAALYAFNK